MQLLIEIIFWFLVFLPVHSYILYPLIIALVAFLKKENLSASTTNGVSILISAFNEEKVIRDRVENLAEMNYDFDLVEVLIGSDKSEDNTNTILIELQEKYSWLKVFCYDQRRGKAGVLNDLVKMTKYDILIFSDANTLFTRNSLALLSSRFTDPETGGVSGRLVLREPETGFNKSVEEKRYWEYETFIKRNEGKCGILIGANGGIFAIRKKLFLEIPVSRAVTDDLYISLAVLQQKFKLVYENEAVAYEDVAREIIHEYRRKIRFASTNFQTLLYFLNLLFNKNLLLSYAFWSHKIIRWFFPHLYIVLLILNVYLLGQHPVYTVMLLLQAIFFILAAAGYLVSIANLRIGIITIPYFFLLTNVALLTGFVRFLKRKHSIIWESTPR